MTGSMIRVARLWAMLVLAPALIIPQAGCTRITLISSYDEQIDHSATDLQRRMDAFLTMLADKEGAPQASYDSNKTFYSDYAVDLRSLKVRAMGQPKNQITGQQLDLMLGSLEELRKAHQSGPIAADAVPTFRDLFNQSWGAIIALEMAKKRGESSADK
ncbi:MAG TPA: hypothetical protein VIG08_01945 [Gemmatimonadales bacterium]|jgi:hypothetical protein